MTYEFTAGSKAFRSKHDGTCSERGASLSRGEQIIKTTTPIGEEDRKHKFAHLWCALGRTTLHTSSS